MSGEFLSGPLRMAMILAAEGRQKEASAMMERYRREMLERRRRKTEENSDQRDD